MDIPEQQIQATATIQIIRDDVAPDAPQTGHLTLGAFQCDTLERPNSDSEFVCIPKGTYPIVMAMSPHFGVVLPHVQNVPGRSNILLHWGNTISDSEGCILCGTKVNPEFIENSRVAVEALIEAINVLGAGTPLQLVVL